MYVVNVPVCVCVVSVPVCVLRERREVSNDRRLTHNQKGIGELAVSPSRDTAILQCSHIPSTAGMECGPGAPVPRLPELNGAVMPT